MIARMSSVKGLNTKGSEVYSLLLQCTLDTIENCFCHRKLWIYIHRNIYTAKTHSDNYIPQTTGYCLQQLVVIDYRIKIWYDTSKVCCTRCAINGLNLTRRTTNQIKHNIELSTIESSHLLCGVRDSGKYCFSSHHAAYKYTCWRS